MKKALLTGIATLFLATGPANAQPWIDAAHNQRCISMGYKPGTALYLECRKLLTAERFARQDRINRAVRNLSESLKSTQPQAMPPPPLPPSPSTIYILPVR
jgi:hypothetical protein